MTKKKKHLKLHSSLPEGYPRWKAYTSPIAGADKPLTPEMVENFFGRFGGWICGRCKKRMTEDEGKYRMIKGSTYIPTVGEIQLPPTLSQYKYCPRCYEALENEGKPNLEVVKEE